MPSGRTSTQPCAVPGHLAAHLRASSRLAASMNSSRPIVPSSRRRGRRLSSACCRERVWWSRGRPVGRCPTPHDPGRAEVLAVLHVGREGRIHLGFGQPGPALFVAVNQDHVLHGICSPFGRIRRISDPRLDRASHSLDAPTCPNRQSCGKNCPDRTRHYRTS